MNMPNKSEFLEAVQKLAESVYDFHHRWNLINEAKSPFESIIERKKFVCGFKNNNNVIGLTI